MPDLPSPAEMLIKARSELDKAYGALGDAADWLRSDWQPGSEMTPDQAKYRARLFRAIDAAKAAINAGRGAPW